ncbi:MAG TPA: hypothetical protein VGG94_01070 [Chthoniobacterales bacterium]|jgi:hypothetical protein
MPNFGYHFARFHGNLVRRVYRALLPVIVRRGISSPRALDLEVFAYSNEENLPEQVASIRSFLRHAGRPRKFTIVSDGSHQAHSLRLLKRIDPIISVRQAEAVPEDLPEKFRRYLEHHATGKQLALIMRLPHDGPALYIDSDVLFFAGAADLVRQLGEAQAPACYLPDCQFAGDERLLRDSAERREPANTGVLLLFRRLDWSLGMGRFLELEGEAVFFTNQTITHLTMHQNGARALDPARYVLQLDDQFVYADRYAGADLALRHYVNPVRHKFWTSLNH